jgi:hypothetical protein
VAFLGFGRPNDRLQGYIVSLDSLSTKFAHPKKTIETDAALARTTTQQISLVFGWDVTSRFLSVAHDMDKHFVDTCPRQNIPVMLSV